MERLLFSEEMDKINKLYEDAFDLEKNIVYFPVRHHSPACSFHLKKVIEEYKPEIILIEGPNNANHLIPSLVHEDSKTPLSIYYTYSDSKELLGEKDDKYMCYYPFLDYSPEFVALKTASKKNILVKFIDLSYEQILINSDKGEGVREKFEKKNYNDDYIFDRSKFIKEICKKQNCRNFNELWEKLYEIDGINISTQTFIKNILAYCYLSRLDLSEEMLEQDGCIAREKYMNMQIEKYSEKHNKVLVITGGIHTLGLINLRGKDIKTRIKRVIKDDTNAYAMAYSFKECDQLNGYASGMPYTAFYNKVWENICENKELPYEDAVMDFIAKCGRELRENGEGISTADSIEALNMAKGLASLRDKLQCGAYELLDGVRSSFIKGEISVSNSAPIDSLNKLMTGDKIGELSSTADIPPIVLDFRNKCKQLRIKIDTSCKQSKTLDIYKTKSHRQVSKLFHMMNFLETEFCIRTKGPDFTIGRNTNLIRETWEYKWDPSVETKLIEHSVYGGSLKEAVREIIVKKMKDIESHSGQASELMINAAVMGLEDLVDKILLQMELIIQNDGEFYSLTQACNKLHFLYKEKYLMDILNTEKIEILIKKVYEKSASLISELYNISKDDENYMIQKLKELYNISMDNSLSLNDDIYTEQLRVLINRKDCNTALEGAGVGILIGLNELDIEEGIKRSKSYLYSSGEKLFESARYLKGIFSTARDLIMCSDGLINGIDHMLREIEYEDFIKIIPEMRLAFSFFIPSEIDEIGNNVGKLYNKSSYEVLDKEPVSEEDIILAKKLDEMAVEQLNQFGIL
ncbi:DUF5682 family protein [Tepidibacter hydrothermalis]|uniref:DUF5682 family protein n=1 Tax=Tepidibacter hydrothermalis TaxID=3036126 RepID=A0ABY8EA95_9FIRM|nr:DUF5682 family protein [Tepidibacter hydrothermalis]WFD09721.1 DUF5682 family protein [Tepidibacter hydrothermalis]